MKPTKKGDQYRFKKEIYTVYYFVGNSGKRYNTLKACKKAEKGTIVVINTLNGGTLLRDAVKV